MARRAVDKAVDNCVDSRGLPCGCDDILIPVLAPQEVVPERFRLGGRDLFHVKLSACPYYTVCWRGW